MREVTSYWYPTWLAQPAALTPNSKLLDCPPHNIGKDECLRVAKDFDHVIIHTSTPSLKNDCRVAEAIKAQKPDTKIGFVGPHAAVLPTETLKASPAIDWVGRKEFDYTCKEVAEGRDLATIAGLSYKDKDGKIRHNPERALIENLDSLPWMADIYRRDVDVRKYFNGYLNHPYMSLYTGRGCPAQCTFCLWPQTIGGHKYRVRSAQNVADEMAYLKKLFPEVKEYFFDDDTFTANLPRAREIAKKIAPLGLTWSCNSRANLDYDNIKLLKDNGLRLFLVGYESGNEDILRNIKKGVTLDEMRRFTKACNQAGVLIHGTFILGLPVETSETIEQTLNFAKELDVSQHPGQPRRALSRHGIVRAGPAQRLVCEEGKDRSAGRRRLPEQHHRISRPEQGRNFRGQSTVSIAPTISVRNPSCASSRPCWRTRTCSCAAAAKASSFSGPCASAKWTPPLVKATRLEVIAQQIFPCRAPGTRAGRQRSARGPCSVLEIVTEQ